MSSIVAPNGAPATLKVVQEIWQPREYRGPKPAKYLVDGVTRRGGFNRFGDPMYRLIWAPARLTPVGGTWKDYEKDTSAEDRVHHRVKPIRVVSEVRLRPRYPTQPNLWVLERWQPPENYGSRNKWYTLVHFGGTMLMSRSTGKLIPALGMYPDRGEYEDTNFAYKTSELSERSVLGAIGAIEKHLADLPPLGVRVQNSIAVAQMEEEVLDQKMTARAMSIVEECMPAFDVNTPMIGYGGKKGRASDEVIKRLRIKEHV